MCCAGCAWSAPRLHCRFTAAPSPLAGIPIKWTTTGFIPPGTLPNTNPIPPAITRHTALVHDLCG